MKKIKNSRENQNIGLIFVLPFLVGLIAFFVPIIVMGIRFAFSEVAIDGGLKMTFTGFDNMIHALRVDAKYFQLVIADISDLISTLPIVVVFSLFVAVLLNSKVWGKSVFRVIFFLPVIACVGMLAAANSGIVMSSMASSAAETDSEVLSAMSDVTKILQNMSFSPELVGFVSGAANNIMNIVNRSGVQILIFLAGIQSISPSIYEAAHVEGASSWEVFWKITLPMLSPMMVVNVLFTFVDSITRADTELIGYIKNMAFSQGQFGYSAAMSWFHYFCLIIMLALLGAAFLIIRKFIQRNKEVY